MRLVRLAATIAAAGMAAPAHAVVTSIAITAYGSGAYISNVYCNGVQFTPCGGSTTPEQNVLISFVTVVNLTTVPTAFDYYLNQTTNADFPRYTHITGTVYSSVNGFVGTDLNYFRVVYDETSFCRAGEGACSRATEVLYAPVFGVSIPVPEPASWAMMVAGFGAVGYALRRRQQVRVSYAA